MTISRACTPSCSRGSPIQPVVGLDTSTSVATAVALGSRPPLPAVAAARVGRDDRALVPVDGARRAPRRDDRDRPRLRRTAGAARADRLRRADPRHADPACSCSCSITASRQRFDCPRSSAALLGLALNYAAYESEIYRSALEAIPTGQLEAARTLGLSERQVLRLVRGPQAFRLALAPMTNDFVALLKDSSLVSVLTVLELTKQTQIFATNLGSWVHSRARFAPRCIWRCHCRSRGWRAGSNGNGERLAEHRPAGRATCTCSAVRVRSSPASASTSSAAIWWRSWVRLARARRRSSARSPASSISRRADRHRRRRADRRRACHQGRRCASCDARSAWCSSSIACSSI